MPHKTEIIVRNSLSLFEHRFIGGEPDLIPGNLESQHRDVAPEHRSFGVVAEHRTIDGIREHRIMEILAEHRTLDISGSELDPLVLDEATLKLSKPHLANSVTVQRRSDGSFFLIIEE
jgi:hypothetical protein